MPKPVPAAAGPRSQQRPCRLELQVALQVHRFVLIAALPAFLWLAGPSLEGEEVVTRLTHSEARNGQAFFSPDGQRISFISNRENGWQIWLMSVDGAHPRRLTSEEGPVGWPSWSKDGETIYFYGQRDGEFRLLRLDLESGRVERLGTPDFPAFRPLLSPSGKQLLFDAVDPEGPGNHDLYVRELPKAEIRRLTLGPGYDSDARWSPDGSMITFHSDRGQERHHTQIHIVSSTGGVLYRLTSGPAKNAYPSWSPNGQCLVYTSELGGNRDLWLMGTKGQDPVRLTWYEGLDSEPVWGRGRLLFSTDRFGGAELAYLDPGKELSRRCED